MATFDISKELVVTLNYYFEKKGIVETTLKCLFFKVPLEFSLDISTTDSEL